MPNTCQQIKEALGLQPGDIILTEMPFEDAVLADYQLRNPLKDFTPTHVSIYTGDFEKPFAHSVQEGRKLPGIRLTKAWDGRHRVYRLNDPELAMRAALIARRWAISIDLYDEEKFTRTYPRNTWDKQHDYYKREYFSLPGVTISGPATPYDLDRANMQNLDAHAKPI